MAQDNTTPPDPTTFPCNHTINDLLNPLLLKLKVNDQHHYHPPQSEKRNPINDFNYPANLQGVDNNTMLPFPEGWKYIDMNITIPKLTEPSADVAFMDKDTPYPTLKQSYQPPEILQRIFDTPADPEYNKFSQTIFVTPKIEDIEQLIALHEIKKSYIAYIIEDKTKQQAQVFQQNLANHYALLDAHVQQYILQLLAPPPQDKEVTHITREARYLGEEMGLDYRFKTSDEGKAFIEKMNEFWAKAEAADYKNIQFPTNEATARDTQMQSTQAGAETSGEDTPVINLINKGATAIQNGNVLADQMQGTTNTNKTTDDDTKQPSNSTTTDQTEQPPQEKILYVPSPPEAMTPIQPITHQQMPYEKARRRQLKFETVVDKLYFEDKFDETKYTQTCQKYHDDPKYTLQQVEKDLTKRKKKEKKKVRFGGSQFGKYMEKGK